MDAVFLDVYTKRYYDSFLAFLQVVGAHQSILKMGLNVENGEYVVQEVAGRYGYRDGAMDEEIHARDVERHQKLKDLNYWSQKVGYLPMNEEGMAKVLKFAEDVDRRRWLRDNVRRLAKKDELLSVADLMRKRYALEKKKRNKERGGT